MNLDDALQAWATQEVALPAPVAADIFREIVAPSAGLDPRWWTRFSAQLAANVVAGTRPRVPVVGLRPSI
ncbi:hypothetical protein ACWEOZ_36075 [Actinoplanes sp. NPDC004185]